MLHVPELLKKLVENYSELFTFVDGKYHCRLMARNDTSFIYVELLEDPESDLINYYVIDSFREETYEFVEETYIEEELTTRVKRLVLTQSLRDVDTYSIL